MCERGFTLIEILVALTILAIGLLALATVMRDNISRLDQVKNRIASYAVAENILNMKILNMIPATTTQGKIRFRVLNHIWYWKSKTTENDVPYRNKVEVRVSFEKSGHFLSHVTGFQFNPIPLNR